MCLGGHRYVYYQECGDIDRPAAHEGDPCWLCSAVVREKYRPHRENTRQERRKSLAKVLKCAPDAVPEELQALLPPSIAPTALTETQLKNAFGPQDGRCHGFFGAKIMEGLCGKPNCRDGQFQEAMAMARKLAGTEEATDSEAEYDDDTDVRSETVVDGDENEDQEMLGSGVGSTEGEDTDKLMEDATTDGYTDMGEPDSDYAPSEPGFLGNVAPPVPAPVNANGNGGGQMVSRVATVADHKRLTTVSGELAEFSAPQHKVHRTLVSREHSLQPEVQNTSLAYYALEISLHHCDPSLRSGLFKKSLHRTSVLY